MSDLNFREISGKGIDKHDDFMQSLKAQKKSSGSLDQMIKNNRLEATQESIQNEATDMSVMGQTFRALKAPKKGEELDEVKKLYAERAKVLGRKESADEFADQFSGREGNREYHLDPKALSTLAFEDLGINIHEDSSPDEIIQVVQNRLLTGKELDPAFLNKGLEFLLEVAQAQINIAVSEKKEHITKIYDRILAAQEKFVEIHGSQILEAEKIIGAVDAISNSTGISIGDTLTRCRDIVHNPPDLQTLRKYYEINGKGYKEMKLELDGLSRYLNVNFKRNNLENSELAQLAKAARKMQALIHVYLEAAGQCNSFLKGYLKSNHLLAA